ncbi:hypothetical protein C8Q73DRAFT_676266 [Cubamyces lactineus]|nr:hypothetical protein C8Q73DRAFT_676266 [Cubamyces lactineus]
MGSRRSRKRDCIQTTDSKSSYHWHCIPNALQKQMHHHLQKSPPQAAHAHFQDDVHKPALMRPLFPAACLRPHPSVPRSPMNKQLFPSSTSPFSSARPSSPGLQAQRLPFHRRPLIAEGRSHPTRTDRPPARYRSRPLDQYSHGKHAKGARLFGLLPDSFRAPPAPRMPRPMPPWVASDRPGAGGCSNPNPLRYLRGSRARRRFERQRDSRRPLTILQLVRSGLLTCALLCTDISVRDIIMGHVLLLSADSQ